MTAFSMTTLLDSATTTAIKRLVNVLRQVARVSGQSKMHRLTLVEHRVSYLCQSHRVPEAYSYVAQEALNLIENMYERMCKRDEIAPRYEQILRELSTPASPLHRSGEWKKSLGLEGDAKEVEKKCEGLKQRVKEMLRPPRKAQK